MYNPYEYLYMIHQKDDFAYKETVRKCYSYIRMVVNAKTVRNMELKLNREDIIQETLVDTVKCLEEYREDCDCQFRTYLQLIVSRRISAQFRRFSSTKYIPLYKQQSMDAQVSGCSNEMDAHELYGDPAYWNQPNYKVHSDEAIREIYKNIQALKRTQKEVIVLSLNGLSYQEGADKLHISVKTYGNRLRYARRKLKEQFQDSEIIPSIH